VLSGAEEMTYHHLNRLEAHSNANQLTPSERLVAWKIASEIRLKEGFYSTAQRTLEEDLNIHRRNIRRILSRLVDDLELFTAQKGLGKQATKYRLNVFCPLNCEDLEVHNTPRELKFINAELDKALNSDTPIAISNGRLKSQKSVQIAPNIEKREEEDSFADFEEKKLLGLIKKTLAEMETLSADHFTLKGFSTIRPKQVLAAIRELFEAKNLDTWKRQEPYLKRTIQNSPQNLIGKAQEADLIETYLNSPEMPLESLYTAETGYKAGHTPERLETFTATYLSNSKTELRSFNTIAGNYLNQKAKAGTLTEEVLSVAETLFHQLKKAFSFAGIETSFEQLKFSQDYEGKLKVEFDSPRTLGDLEGLLTEEEKQRLKERNQAITEAKTKFMLENQVEGEHLPNKFWVSDLYKGIDQQFPHPLTQKDKEQRLESALEALEEAANSFMDLSEAESAGKRYLEFLQENYTWETDLKEFLNTYPETSSLNTPETTKHFLAATKVLPLEEILEKAQRYKNTLGDTYPKAPQNWLKDLLQQLSLFGGK
jgi:hypothetical protein